MRTLVGFLPLAAATVLLTFWKVVDSDVWWHLKTGQVILDTGRLLRTNHFSAPFQNYPWTNPEWLFQATLALVHRAGGWPAVQVFRVAIAMLLGGILYASAVAATRRHGLSAALALTTLAMIKFRFTERPHLLSLLLFTIVVCVVERHRRHGGRALWVLPPLFALWSNIHPELIIGLLYLLAVAAGEAVNRRQGGDRDATEDPARMGVIAALSLAATLLNPAGWQVLRYPFLHLGLDRVIEVFEFQATGSSHPLYWLLLPLGLGVLLLPPRRDWRDVLPAAGLGVLGALYLRETPYFLLAATPAVARRLAELRSRRGVEAASLVIAAAALVWSLGWDRILPYHRGWGVDDGRYPVAAARLLAGERWEGNLYNHFNVGGYLIFTLFPGHRVFQDGRIPAYPASFLARLHAQSNIHDWSRMLEDYRISVALVHATEPVAAFRPGDWGLVFWDDQWRVFVRRGGGNDELLARREYRWFTPDRRLEELTEPRALAELAREMSRNQAERQHPSAEVATDLGVARVLLQRTDEAEAAFRQAIGIDGTFAPAWSHLGLLLAYRGRAAEAVSALTRAVALDPKQEAAARTLAELTRRGSGPGPGGP